MTWNDVCGFWNEIDRIEYDRLINLIPDESCMVEVGCFRGKSLSSVAPTLRRKKIQLIVVDTFGTIEYNEPGVESKKNGMLQDFAHTMRAFGLDPLVICGNSNKASRYISWFRPSLVFIDADHSYEAVREDINCWWPNIKASGVLAGHDIDMVRESWPGVKKAVTECFGDRFNVNGNIWSARKG